MITKLFLWLAAGIFATIWLILTVASIAVLVKNNKTVHRTLNKGAKDL